MPTYLVTGGSGFIGSALCRRLAVRPGTRVVNVDNLSYAGSLGSTRSIERLPAYRFVHADVANDAAMTALMREERVDAVIHLAAQTHVDRSITDPSAFLYANAVGTHHLLVAVLSYWETLSGAQRDAFRFHHVSTDEVFGTVGDGEGGFSESSAYAPSSPYSASKAASDHFVRAWHRTYGLPVTLSNCSNNYGPFQYPEKLIPVVILNALSEMSIPVYGDGRHVREWLHVDDHVSALERIMQAGTTGESYNIGGGFELQNVELVELTCRMLDELRPRRGGASYADLIAYVADRPGHDRRYAVDSSKLRRELGWRPETELTDGLARTVRWYLDNQWWWAPLLSPEADRAAGNVGTAAE